jgi:aspartate aminotransferase
MTELLLSQRMSRISRAVKGLMSQIEDPEANRRKGDPLACDFMLGDPHDGPVPGYVEALQRHLPPQNKDWFAYKMNEPQSQQAVAESLQQWRRVAYQPQDIFLTTGAFSALSVTLNAILDPGDEVIFISPPWFFYEALILAAQGEPVRVKVGPDFDLDLGSIDAAITPRTRAIIINSPNNPTGRIYPQDTLNSLGLLLESAQMVTGRPIYLISDESYSKIIFDGRTFISPTRFYAYSLLIYTYGKTLLAPGQRIGFIALPPEMPNPEAMRNTLFLSQMVSGYAFPNAVLQHALSDLDQLSIDVAHLQTRRDRMVPALRAMGYQVNSPEGTFYLLVKSPWPDELAFVRQLHSHQIYCMPGTAFEMPGYFRISLTANDAMIERALPGFEKAYQHANQPDKIQA